MKSLKFMAAVVAAGVLLGCARYGAVVQQMKTNENAAIEAAKGKGNGTPAVLERLSALEAAFGVR